MQVEAAEKPVGVAGRGRYHKPFRNVAILGAGTMGAQIAAHLANAGLEVLLLDLPGKESRNEIVNELFARTKKIKPDPFFVDAAIGRVDLGNFEDDFERLAKADWVIEAVIERMDIKREIAARLAATVGPDTVVSTNTSGLPIHEIVEGQPESLRKRFLGTHFFNPPRYLKLLEVIPTPDTDPAVLHRVTEFGRVHLGKGIVIAKDRPYFIGNRIGIYAMLSAIRFFEEGKLTIEEIDALTGPLAGRPKSATFRTADVVGLDVMKHVIENLHGAVTGDESIDAFKTPPVLDALLAAGALGAKTGAGYYRKEGKVIKSIDPATREYTPAGESSLDLGGVWKAGKLPDRIRALYAADGLAGEFFRTTTLDLLGYASRRIPEITDHPADVDRAIRWGFGWEAGPFEIWDMLGLETVIEGFAQHGIETPDWVDEMRAAGTKSFYETRAGKSYVYTPAKKDHKADPSPPDELSIAAVITDPSRTLWKNDEAALLDIGEGVALYEFRSKANALGKNVMEGLWEVIGRVENDNNLRGLVIGNEGKNFSVGANLMEVAMTVQQGQFELLDTFLRKFQGAVQRIRYAGKPVVVSVHQMALGGGCEIAMACPNPVVAGESYIGLVELGVGVIPAGTGTTRLAVSAAESAPNGFVSEIQGALNRFFETVASAKVSKSGAEAVALGYLPASTRVVMNADRRLYVARERVIDLSNSGYLPPPKPRFTVVGRPGAATLEAAAYNFLQGRYISEYDYYLASRLAYVMTGGSLTGPQEVDEDYLIDLEREVFLELLGQKKTQERIEHMLKTNKPLRN